jgi:hypothetical protein
MAFFAKLNENNVVTEVNVIDDKDINFLQFPASEPVGVQFLTEWSKGHTNWKQTSETRAYRTHYAATGFTYNPELDVFVPPKPFASWLFNSDTVTWSPPVPYPTDNKTYTWDEATLSWITPTPMNIDGVSYVWNDEQQTYVESK